ncbi:MAG: hypothetical protein JWM11_1559 [Planctomycetaceae bacterium]|nr:hypothetical protein [Planctomycetaceae bacterium]
MSRNWWRNLLLNRFSSQSRRPARSMLLASEQLETRIVMTVQPVSVADPSLFGDSGLKDSSAPSISADGQLIAFQSKADNLVPNDTDGQSDAFVFNRTTGIVTLISVGLDGTAVGKQIDDASPAVISPDGRYVAFMSNSGDIIPGFTNFFGHIEVYVRDLSTGTTSLVSVAPDGVTAGDGSSSAPVFSADSRHIGFASDSGNLVAGPQYHGNLNLFERDLTTGTTQLVTIGHDGINDGDNSSGPMALSSDGSIAVFQSSAENLVSNDNNGIEDVFVRNMVTGITTLVSVDSSGLTSAAGHSMLSSSGEVMSSDGRYVVFHSNAPNIVTPAPGGPNSYLRDLQTGTTVLVSTTPEGLGANSNGSEVLSPDGRWVAFATASSDLVPLPTNESTNVYVRNIQTGVLSLVSVNLAGTAGGNDNSGIGTFFDSPGGLSFSADGSSLAFRSLSTDLTPGVVTATRNLYVRNLDTGTTTLITPNLKGNNGAAGDADATSPAVLSANGQFIAFEETADDLVSRDNNHQQDVFVSDVKANQSFLVSTRSPQLPAAFPAAEGGELNSISADGRFIAFTSSVFYGQTFSDLAPTITFSSTISADHVFVRDQQTGQIVVADLDSNGIAVGGSSPVLSPDGRYVAFLGANNLLPSGITTSGDHDLNVFVRDLQTNTTTIASLTPDGTHDVPVTAGTKIAISDDGRFVSFSSNVADPIPGVTNPNQDQAIFIDDLQTGTTTLVSHDTANDGQINGNSVDFSISNDGRYVVFRSADANLVNGDLNNGSDVYRWDRTTNAVSLVSVNASGTGAGNSESAVGDPPKMTPDGRFIVFTSDASDLVSGSGGNVTDIFLRDMGDGTTAPSTTVMDINSAGTGPGNDNSFAPSISADGTKIAFVSNATDLTTDPSAEGGEKTYVRDRITGTTTLATVNLAGEGVSGSGFISSNGRFVLFESGTAGIVPGFVDGNGGGQDLYLRDLQQHLTKLVTVNQSGTASGNADSSSSNATNLFSTDGSTLIFDSSASDLLPGDRNELNDVFAYQVAGFGSISGHVFDDSNHDGMQENGEAGVPYTPIFIDLNGNGKLDPTEPNVTTDADGNYAFTGLVAGSYRVTLGALVGRVQSLPANDGNYSVTLATDTTSVTARDFGLTIPQEDLKVQSVIVPATGATGGDLQVSWTVANLGTTNIAGDWQDAVYLSSTPTINGQSTLVEVVPHTGGLATEDSYTESLTLHLPTVPEGNYFVVISTDRRRQVGSDTNLSNNIGASAKVVNLSVPVLTLNSPASGQFSAAGQDHYYKINVNSGDTLLLSLSESQGSNSNQIFGRFGALPTAYLFDVQTPPNPGANPTLSVPVTETGTYYILVHNQAGTPGNFTLTATQPGLTILQVSPRTVGNAGRTTLAISGVDLQSDTLFKSVGPSGTITATATQFIDSTLVYATFDFTGAVVGSYAITAKNKNGQIIQLSGAVQVTTGVGPDVVTSIIGPSLVRAGRPFEFLVTYSNTGDADAPVPLINIANLSNEAIGFSPDDVHVAPNLQFLALSPNGPPGILRPGATYQTTIYVNEVLPAGTDTFTFELNAHTGQDSAPTDWNLIDSFIPGAILARPDWAAIEANLQQQLGPTWGDTVTVLAADAAQAQVGTDIHLDPAVAVGIEVQKAIARLGNLPNLALAADTESSPSGGLIHPHQEGVGGQGAYTGQIVRGFDPNDIVGLAGFGTAGFLPANQLIPYTIDFENDPSKATAPAQEVTVTQTLDANLDLSTFELGDIRFGSTVVPVLSGLQSYQTSVNTTNLDGSPLRVDISASLNRQTGVVTWTFHSIDPATGQLPADPEAGFLPPDDASGRGEASVHYTIRSKANLTTGSQITAQASVVFDTNAPLATAVFSNRIDAAPPTSNVAPLPATTSTPVFNVMWSGTDDAGGSGLATYDIYVSDNNGPYTLWLTDTALTAASYTGQNQHTYRFYAVATDNVGQVESGAQIAEATTTVNEVPQLAVNGPAVTWTNKQPAVTILPQITVDGVGLAGGTLTISVTAIGSKKKSADLLLIPATASLGTSSGPQYANGHTTVQVQLGQNATASAIQRLLRVLTFATTGKGLNTATRTLTVTLSNGVGGQAPVVSQTIHIVKKAPKKTR